LTSTTTVRTAAQWVTLVTALGVGSLLLYTLYATIYALLNMPLAQDSLLYAKNKTT
jgi:hypothetical protein